MIVVTIDLHSAVTLQKKTLGKMVIANIGGSRERGEYDVWVARKGGTVQEVLRGKKIARTGRVLDYPRLSYNVWRLVCRALKSAFPEEA